MIRVENVHKTFVLHQQHGVRLPVLADSLTVNAGECVVLHGHSGGGKSTLLRSLCAIICRTAAISISATATNGWTGHRHPRKVLEVRSHHRLGQPVSTGDPRISALEVVMQPLLDLGTPREASAKNRPALTRLNVRNACGCLRRPPFPAASAAVNIARGLSTIRSCSLMNPPPHWMARCCRGQPDPRCQSARRAIVGFS